MTKNELIEAIATETGQSKTLVSDILVVLGHVTRKYLKAGDEVVVGDIGKLKSVHREAREARSPATGQTVKVPAKNVVKFKPAKSLSDAIA